MQKLRKEIDYISKTNQKRNYLMELFEDYNKIDNFRNRLNRIKKTLTIKFS